MIKQTGHHSDRRHQTENDPMASNRKSISISSKEDALDIVQERSRDEDGMRHS